MLAQVCAKIEKHPQHFSLLEEDVGNATLRKAQNLNRISTNFPKAKLVPQSKHCQRACAREKIRTNAKLINRFRAAKNYIGIFFTFTQKSIF